ncbi:unnamed protein product [Strongylus vulgaris]|uniref:Receptor ligand binding region domain-containing protein n=1 Tax=Strongylus vulgaris TaxID=40348 RepID=A0A3P7L8A2_STRVU|nr:unnamed protein product [Strongylus vulgaris]
MALHDGVSLGQLDYRRVLQLAYCLAKFTSKGDVVPIWQDTKDNPDGRDEHAKKAFANSLVISEYLNKGAEWVKFKKSVVERMRQPPFNCIKECSDPAYSVASDYCTHLYNLVIMYATALNRTIKEDAAQVRNGTRILINLAGDYPGILVNRTVEATMVIPKLQMENIDSKGSVRTLMMIVVGRTTKNLTVMADPAVIWSNYGGKKPLSEPVCGFSGKEQYYIIIVKHSKLFFNLSSVPTSTFDMQYRH